MHWSAKYLGIPYVEGACGETACDCWGLVRMVFQKELGYELPEVTVGKTIDNTPAIRACMDEWKAAEDYKEYDAVTMRNALGHHIGVVAKVDGEIVYILHCNEPFSSVMKLSDLQRIGYKDFRIWRHG